ncbi:RagB/SusD family nutrient uptake outer membrane protein [Pedobacter sp. L105]|uniref:RagB/SusD family nutrient uptake outer membrane protein n=1 Tax=Pedobacter sp. L105 TaxID=1641871 RepID=UPI00131B6339|nr:RagB/SusD family nutrient uptake outer membrane protein [Pedobacter sp. L105]
MKQFLYICLAGTLLVSSCKKDLALQPISNNTTDTYFTTPNDFLQATNAVYNSLHNYPDRQLNLSETRSDNLYAVSQGGVRDWEGINDFFSTLASNPYLEEAWSTNFNGISRANTILDQLTKNGTVVPDVTLRNRYQAEAKFLRAMYYFDLVRWFGKVPLIDHPILTADALTIPRSAVADVYALIISDLQFAIANLPQASAYAAVDKGRANKYSAKSLLALVYMTRSGPTYGVEGPGLALNEWSLAEAQLNDIISSGQYSLITNTGTATTAYANIFSYTNENNSEVVFDVEYSSGSVPVLGATYPWVLVPDAYFQSIGKPVQGGLEIRPVSNNLLSSYETGDVRKAFTIQPGYTAAGGVVETQSFFKKYVDISKVPANRTDWPINFIVSRYTDILLLKAECVLHGAAGSQSTDVDNVVNTIRIRAGLAGNQVGVTLPQLMEERRKEFAAEGTRWHDLVRSGLVTTVMPAWVAVDDVKKLIQPFKTNYVIYPVPQSQLDVKPGLYTQNAGY